MFRTLIDAPTLATHRQHPRWRVVDCRFDLRDAGAGRRLYQSGHIPGAVFADLEQDLSGPITPATGRHPLPDRAALSERLGRLGIGTGMQVVAYDDGAGAFAARLWWLLRWLGHEEVAVLDGGLAAWTGMGLPLSTGEEPVSVQTLPLQPPLESAIDTAQVRSRLGDDRWLLVDARAPERYRGDVEPIDPVAGHVPGALNHPFSLNLDGTGRFLERAELRRRYETLLGSHDAAHSAFMCGSGVTACHDLLALAHAGMPGAHLYAGSWSEWIRDSGNPVVRGPKP